MSATVLAYEGRHAMAPGVYVLDRANVRGCGCGTDCTVFGHVDACSWRGCWQCRCSRCPCPCHERAAAA